MQPLKDITFFSERKSTSILGATMKEQDASRKAGQVAQKEVEGGCETRVWSDGEDDEEISREHDEAEY